MYIDFWTFISCMTMLLCLTCCLAIGISFRTRQQLRQHPRHNQVLDLSHLENNEFLRVQRIINIQFGGDIEQRENQYYANDNEDLETIRETENEDIILENTNIV